MKIAFVRNKRLHIYTNIYHIEPPTRIKKGEQVVVGCEAEDAEIGNAAASFQQVLQGCSLLFVTAGAER